ncbi:MAG TPA: tetratricopeptide repeat protein, partial [Armatimonadota bacterium]
VLLLCTFRPDPSHACWSVAHEARALGPERYLEVRLRELTAEQSRGMVGSLLRQSELPVLLEGTVLERSQGNPLYVEELVRTLIDAGSLYQEEGVWVARDARETLLLPDSVQSIIQTRVDRLSPSRKQVLEYAAVFGRLLRRDLLEAVMAGQDDLTASLEELSLRGFLVQGRHGPGEEYSFRHVLAQETVYQALLKGRKSLLHRKAAEAVEALYGDSLEPFYEDLAHHYGNTADAEKTVHYLLRSGEKARRTYLNDAAISYLTRSLARMDEAEDPTGQIASPWYSQRLEALRSLGLLYQGMGKVAEAETCLRQAIATSESLELPVAERVRLYYWLSDVLWWQCRYEETIALGQTGLALLGDDSHSTEAALMNTAQAISYMNLGDRLRFWELTQRNARFISELPYTEELRPSYGHIFAACAYDDKDPEAARGWLDKLEVLAERHQDLRALGMIWGHRGSLARSCGDLSGAIGHFEEALAIYTRIGDAKHRGDFLDHLGWTHLILGDPQKASEYEALAVSILQEVGNRRDMAWTMMTAATMAFCRGDLQEAVGQATQALEGYHSISHPYEAMAALTLAWVLLACGERSQAMFLLASAVAMVDIQQIQSYPREFAIAIAGLERACERREDFLAFCKGLQERRLASGAREELGFQSCCLTPGGSPRRGAVAEQWSDGGWPASWQANTPPEPWRWEDPYGDCTCSPVAAEQAMGSPVVLMQAPNGRDLWRINLSAPRLLLSVRGSFALEVTCTPSEAGTPSIGGLLLWWDRGNYLRLDRGTRGPTEISLSGCVRNEDVLWGRGMLPDSEAVTLRLERVGDRVWALCRAGDGEWHTLGEAPVPQQEELGAGLFASGTIDRRVYPGAYPEGSAIRFTALKLEQL